MCNFEFIPFSNVIFKVFNPFNINHWVVLILAILGITYVYNLPRIRIAFTVIMILNIVMSLYGMEYNRQLYDNDDMEPHLKYVGYIYKFGLVVMVGILVREYTR
jgi:hypothetical protein